MKLNIIWNNQKGKDCIDIISHPINHEIVTRWQSQWMQAATLQAIQPSNQRTLLVALQEIEAIETMGHMSKIHMLSGDVLWLQKKLKELTYLEASGFYRINNSTILNIQQISAFSAGQHARLEVFTKNQQTYIVSRHYAKLVKEQLQ
ncbi:LytTR family DNA-binding domain-containing protein [Enterococcus sp. AZ072]|uniref:LytTR family DNA-binding domain-containing protein n=1 Tax=unclassified Enterococcus TaxID=2608891 RepID=UPI003D2978A0